MDLKFMEHLDSELILCVLAQCLLGVTLPGGGPSGRFS